MARLRALNFYNRIKANKFIYIDLQVIKIFTLKKSNLNIDNKNKG